MQQLLVDELTGDRVILAPARALRPDTFRVHADPLPASVADLPVLRRQRARDAARGRAASVAGEPDTPGWTLRVVPNMYPIVGDGVRRRARGRDLLPRARRRLRRALATRQRPTCCSRCATAPRFHLARAVVYAQAFVNQGKAAGASIEHPHAQLVALDFVPPRAQVRLDRVRAGRVRRRPGAPRSSTATVGRRGARPRRRRRSRCGSRSPTAAPRFDEATDDEMRAPSASRCATRSRRSARCSATSRTTS